MDTGRAVSTDPLETGLVLAEGEGWLDGQYFPNGRISCWPERSEEKSSNQEESPSWGSSTHSVVTDKGE